MRKYQSTKEEEEEMTKNFAEKLALMKNNSKNIKMKNIYTSHKIQWVNDYQRMKKMEYKEKHIKYFFYPRNQLNYELEKMSQGLDK